MKALRFTVAALVIATSIGAGIIRDAHADDAATHQPQQYAGHEGDAPPAVQADLLVLAGMLLLTAAILDVRTPDSGVVCCSDDKR